MTLEAEFTNYMFMSTFLIQHKLTSCWWQLDSEKVTTYFIDSLKCSAFKVMNIFLEDRL